MDEVRSVVSQYPSITLLALGLKAKQKDGVRCGRAGFAGYVSRDASPETLVQAMKEAINGQLSCLLEVADELVRALYRGREPAEADSPGEALTPRECNMRRESGNGASNQEIAGEFGLSVASIQHYVHRVFKKLQVVRRAETMRKVRDPLCHFGLPVRLRREAMSRNISIQPSENH